MKPCEWKSVDLGAGGIVSGEPKLVDSVVSIWRSSREIEKEWINYLRAEGIKAAHPDDGWVDREENKIHLAYPYYGCVRNLEVGDLIALGGYEKHRVVLITGFSEGGKLSKGIVRDWDRYWICFEEVS